MIPLGLYRHYKGTIYQVLGLAKHSETLEELVVYKNTKDQSLWARPVSMFLEEVEVNGQKQLRFTRLKSN